MNFEDEEEWDLELLDKLVQSEEQAIAARRAASASASATSLPSSSSPSYPPPLSHTLRRVAPQPPFKQDDHPSLVFELQQRLLQAEQELSELRQKAQKNTVAAASITGEELRRLQAEILFKDQEILEVKRACTEKSEQLKRVSTENEVLRRQFEEVKRVRRQEDLNNVETREEGIESAPTMSKASHGDVSGSQGQLDQDLWYPPWTPTVPVRDGSRLKNSSPQDAQTQCKILGREDPKPISELNIRVLDNGCLPLKDGEDKSCSDQSQQEKTHQIPTRCGNIEGNSEIFMETADDKKGWEHLFLHNLLNIWCPRNMQEESKGLLAKLMAVCEVDMQILLSMSVGEAEDGQQLKKRGCSMEASANHVKKKFSEVLSVSAERGSAMSQTNSLGSILVKVANGLLPSWSFFLAVLELSEVEDIQVSESALRVLHCILTQDEGCHKHLFGRKILAPQYGEELLRTAGHKSFSKESGFHISLRPFQSLSGDFSPSSVFKRYFFSPRISWHFKGRLQWQHNAQDMFAQENIKSEVSGEGSEQDFDEHISPVNCNRGALMGRIFKGALDKAVKACSEAIGITAVSILVAVVINTDPMSARERFGFILFDGSIASLLRISAGLVVRLETVRLVHSLLHCPPVLKKVLDLQESSNEGLDAVASKQTCELMQELEFDCRSTEENVILQNGEEMNAQSETARAVKENSFGVLAGLISCLTLAGFSSQAYSLRRNALRVLTFIATSGQRGAAFLLAKEIPFINTVGLRGATDSTNDNKAPALMSAGSLPMHLIALLDQELTMEEEDGDSFMSMEQIEERESVLLETLTLLCRLASHPAQSSRAVAVLTSNKNIARLSLSVISRLMSRGILSEIPRLQGRQITSPVDVIELCRGLKRRILSNIANV